MNREKKEKEKDSNRKWGLSSDDGLSSSDSLSGSDDEFYSEQGIDRVGGPAAVGPDTTPTDQLSALANVVGVANKSAANSSSLSSLSTTKGKKKSSGGVLDGGGSSSSIKNSDFSPRLLGEYSREQLVDYVHFLLRRVEEVATGGKSNDYTKTMELMRETSETFKAETLELREENKTLREKLNRAIQLKDRAVAEIEPVKLKLIEALSITDRLAIPYPFPKDLQLDKFMFRLNGQNQSFRSAGSATTSRHESRRSSGRHKSSVNVAAGAGAVSSTLGDAHTPIFKSRGGGRLPNAAAHANVIETKTLNTNTPGNTLLRGQTKTASESESQSQLGPGEAGMGQAQPATPTTAAGDNQKQEGQTTTTATAAVTTGQDYRSRLIRFYKHYNRDKLPDVDKLLDSYEEDEELLFQQLVKKYGSEPEAGVESSFLSISSEFTV